ncbi:hypothetical protein MTYP_00431 [Methylophilaceae bacterium]|nr:hypothetical protein MTYP_00431 [Methylophilaceae bacterium]
MNIQQYITKVSILFMTGNSSEHSYRGDLQQLLSNLLKDVLVTNEPKRIECGAPDYILTRKDVPIGYIEAKDIGADLSSKLYKEQFDRYKSALDNLIITDYLQFRFFKNGTLVESVSIAEIDNGKIHARPENFERFTALIENFALQITQTIKSPAKLAQMMASKAKLMAQVIESALDEDDKKQSATDLQGQMAAFKNILIHDIDNKSFADIYAQTIAYGLFAARYHDPTLATFSRQEAATLIPQSNPFLRRLFQYIAGYELDSRLVWLVDELVQIFLASDVASIMHNFGKSTRQQDPIVHFYETFLAAYDAKLRKARGVWYTPEPVVNFIVRAVDDILKTHFNLPQGLADTSKTKVKIETIAPGSKGKPVKQEKELHRVQILDPATGTGTFLAQTIRHIYQNNFANMQGAWPAYVKEHLIPRLNGFELLMTSYAMAHLKLDMLLTETGYKTSGDSERLHVYLTNSLEEHHPDTGTLFASWLSSEANEANHIKRDAPVMVVMGNPPYSGESNNKGKWIMNLMEDYKKEPNGDQKLKEKTTKWINDDYVKFLRYGQHFVEKNESGLVAFINPHGYLDNPTFRGMRWNLLKTYDEIFTIDLHGNSNKKETCPDGSPDINVFDIEQGVSINFFIKTGRKQKDQLAVVHHFDLYGSRNYKYEFLSSREISNIAFKKLNPFEPFYFFTNKDFSQLTKYKEFISISDLFITKGNGVVTKRDSLCIQNSAKESAQSAFDIINLEKAEFYSKYQLPEDVRDWRYDWAKNDIKNNFNQNKSIVEINYRPFDVRYLVYTGQSRGFVGWPVNEVMRNYVHRENVGLLISRMTKGLPFAHCFITNKISEAIFLSSITSTNAFNHPLYIYDENVDITSSNNRRPNLRIELVEKISSRLGIKFTPEKITDSDCFAPIDLLDYIYACLNSPSYRKTYQEFLNVDFPCVPYPKNAAQFWQLVTLGSKLRHLHLMETSAVNITTATYPVTGNNKVDKLRFDDNKVFINTTQYFEGVPQLAWEFYVGGYQPAQKWLKDRKGHTLDFEDILHYQKIIKALVETDRLMHEIDKVGVI